jgi:hypothetical protein
VSVSSLPAGTYELRATVLVANQAVGVTSTSFRKADKQACACGYQPGAWLARGGARGWAIVGATEEDGYRAVGKPKSVYELHARILHLLGLDFEKLANRFNGRDVRLTDVHAKVIKEILA